MIKFILGWFFIVFLFNLLGCKSFEKPMVNDPYYAPVYPETEPEMLAVTGSMFQDTRANLFSDIRAHKVGDIITVVLAESTQASKSANNKLDKSSSLSLAPIFGLGANATIKGSPIDLTYNDKMSTNKASAADQGNSLSGSISANVLQVLNNGNLVIRGEKWMSINNGDEFIRLTGIVRSEDIRPDNTVDSTRIANARIQYSGTGTFADNQKPGWLSSVVFGAWWPF